MLHYLLSISQTSQQASKQSESCYLYSLLNFLMFSCLDGAIYLPYDNRESYSPNMEQCFPLDLLFLFNVAPYTWLYTIEKAISLVFALFREPLC